MIRKLSVFILIVILLVFGTGCGNDSKSSKESKSSEKWSFELSDQGLKSARSQFKTKIVDTSFVPDGKPAVPPTNIFSLVHYPAKDGKMAAYLTPDPKDGKKHPAVIWIHGGYGGIGEWFWEPQTQDNDQSGKALRDAGIITMVPSFRGENDNPGNYEMFYGELDDLESAYEYLSSLPYVDSSRIYLMGHSTGGTTVLLGNEYSNKFRAAFSLGGVPDLKLRIKAGKMMVAIPFDQTNVQEFRLRSPRTFLTSIQSPTFYFEGERAYWPEFDELNKIARAQNIPFNSYKIKSGGDHFNIIHPVTLLVAKKILADTNEKVNIQFSKEDIQWIENNIYK